MNRSKAVWQSKLAEPEEVPVMLRNRFYYSQKKDREYTQGAIFAIMKNTGDDLLGERGSVPVP